MPRTYAEPKSPTAKSQRANRDKGLCGCGQPNISGKKYCEKCRATSLAYQFNLKMKVIEGYGGTCQCPSGMCFETNPGMLTVDHIYNDGRLDRGAGNRGGNAPFYKRLLDHNFPTDKYRLLCWNCNLGRARWEGICPHEQLRFSQNETIFQLADRATRGEEFNIVRY